MKVAIATHFPADPSAPQGGVEAVSVNLAKALSDLPDMEIHVVTLDVALTDTVISAIGNILFHRIPAPKGNVLTKSVGAWRRIIQDYLLTLSPDIVHAHDTYGIMVKGLSLPRVFTIHGFIYGDTMVSEKNFAWLRSKFWWLVETAAWADQPHIISISPYVRERLTAITRGVIHDIDNPVDEDFFHIQRDEQGGTIFSAAVISPRKNTLALIEAFALISTEFPHASLRLAGSIVNAEYGRRIQEKIVSSGLAERVHLLGRLSTPQIHEELSRASIFAMVSLEENSPMGIEEAMAVGVPVVTSNRCGMPYMVRDGESGFLVHPESTTNISRKLRQLLNDNTLRSEFGKKGREIAADRFHPVRVAIRTQAVYEDALLVTN